MDGKGHFDSIQLIDDLQSLIMAWQPVVTPETHFAAELLPSPVFSPAHSRLPWYSTTFYQLASHI